MQLLKYAEGHRIYIRECLRRGAVTHVVECLCAMHEALGLVPSTAEVRCVAQAPDLSIWGIEAGGAEVHCHPQLQKA